MQRSSATKFNSVLKGSGSIIKWDLHGSTQKKQEYNILHQQTSGRKPKSSQLMKKDVLNNIKHGFHGGEI